MNRVEYISDTACDPSSVVTVGTFDGVHKGHQAILEYLAHRARTMDGKGTVVTFDPHPRQVLSPAPVALLTSIEEKTDLLTRFGVDRVVLIPFTKNFSQTPAESFVVKTLLQDVGMKEMVIGHDHHFGHGRGGDEHTLRELGKEHGFSVDVIPARHAGEDVISSSKIRELIERDGCIEQANSMLGYRYKTTANVIRGAGRGKGLGFPTANLTLGTSSKVVPADGVYAVAVRVNGREGFLPGMMNIGNRPTFEGTGRHLEVHIIDFDGDLYGQSIRVEYLSRIRAEKKFTGIEALVEQLNEDKLRCIASFKKKP